MNTLVIYAHPNHQSLSYSFLQNVIRGLSENPQVKEIKVLDLYEEKFNPVLVFNENKRRRDMHADPELEKYREFIRWADKIVFVYPIWWGRPPAILLGFIDRVFASNFAYRSKGGLLPEGLLKGKTVDCVSTMRGPAHYPLFWLNNAHKVLMKRAIFHYVGIKKVKFFEFGNMESPKGRHDKKLNKIYCYFRTVAQ
ncbi:NAD(P)H-dependent oxidoreductase [Cohnella pontilimi]|uniref:NAD(P)H-dependent oxidoreductase n=1 Tax=Cohnella pontilimi TaxID=2564100 RepID=A0A4U0FCI4_9BACL|nr:NAD(P)H-dependent oxidoreductase [Cohnella pontilimi]TJY42583.1 NAD(P)H-dependent oxidoreductase [Cohnella pontilimi]